MFRLIGFGIRVWGCLYLAYWLLFFGIVGVLIITSYLREHKHHPAVKTASHELHYERKSAKTWKGYE